MIYLITGASHTGKTYLAQKLLEKTKISAFSQDHLKMGLIRTGLINVTVYDDDKITESIWPITREMIKTAIENHQNLIVEGCYIPYDWKQSFEPEYLQEIRYVCLVMSETYIRERFADIRKYASVIEDRGEDEDCTLETVLRDNAEVLRECKKYGVNYVLIEDVYPVDFELKMLFEE